jgi:hypothetical protein
VSITIDDEDFPELSRLVRQAEDSPVGGNLRQFLERQSDCEQCGLKSWSSVHIPARECFDCNRPDEHHEFKPSFT